MPKNAFLKNFKWDDSQLTGDDKNDIVEKLKEFNNLLPGIDWTSESITISNLNSRQKQTNLSY